MSSTPVYLGLDIGTSGCRLAVIDRNKKLRAQIERPLPPPDRPTEGHFEQQPEIWWSRVTALFRELTDNYPEYNPRALAIDGTSSTLMLSNCKGDPLAPALMYNDSRSTEEVEILKKYAPAESPVLSASASLAKALHLRKRLSNQTTDVRLVHQADWVLGKLLGKIGVSDDNNCLKLGYDSVNREWPDWLKSLPIPESWYPDVRIPGSTVGLIDRGTANALNLPVDMRLMAGTTDSTAATLAAGISEIGDAVTSLGSTLVLKVLSNEPVFSATHGVYSHRVGKHWLVGGASNSGGAVLKHYFSNAEIARYSKLIDPSSPTNLDYYPLLATGERFPVNDPHKASILTPRPTSDARFFQGILEGIANIEHQGYLCLRQLGTTSVNQIFSTGGGASNALWARIRERTLKIPIRSASVQEACYGAALLALNSDGG